jgi:hypothetical protein
VTRSVRARNLSSPSGGPMPSAARRRVITNVSGLELDPLLVSFVVLVTTK